MAKCSNCGFEAGESKFCPECGTKIEQIRYCVNCGAVVTGKFCGECGTPVMAPSTAAATAPTRFETMDISLDAAVPVADLADEKSELGKKLERGYVLNVRRKYDEAREIYEELVEEYPHNLDAHLGLIKAASRNLTVLDEPRIQEMINDAKDLCGAAEVWDAWPELDDYYDEIEMFFLKLSEEADKRYAEQRELLKPLHEKPRKQISDFDKKDDYWYYCRDLAQSMFDAGIYDELFELLEHNVSEIDHKSQYIMGTCYRKGYGTAVDKFMAESYFHKAAIGGYADAQFELGVMLIEHASTLKRMDAEYWWQEAAKQGHDGAKRMLNEFFKK